MNANEQVTRPGLTWTKLGLWMIVLYIIGLIGFFAKASKQFPGLQFENPWQAVAVAFLPAIPFVIFAVPFLIWLAIKSFRLVDVAASPSLSVLSMSYGSSSNLSRLVRFEET